MAKQPFQNPYVQRKQDFLDTQVPADVVKLQTESAALTQQLTHQGTSPATAINTRKGVVASQLATAHSTE